MSKKKDNQPDAVNTPDVTEETTHPEVSKTLVEEYNETFTKPFEEGTRTLDVLRIRKGPITIAIDKSVYRDFLMNIGKTAIEDGRNTFLSENDSFLTLQETVKE